MNIVERYEPQTIQLTDDYVAVCENKAYTHENGEPGHIDIPLVGIGVAKVRQSYKCEEKHRSEIVGYVLSAVGVIMTAQEYSGGHVVIKRK